MQRARREFRSCEKNAGARWTWLKGREGRRREVSSNEPSDSSSSILFSSPKCFPQKLHCQPEQVFFSPFTTRSQIRPSETQRDSSIIRKLRFCRPAHHLPIALFLTSSQPFSVGPR